MEASLDKGQGPVATVIIKQGTLRTGQFVAVGKAWGKVSCLSACVLDVRLLFPPDAAVTARCSLDGVGCEVRMARNTVS